MAKPPAKQTGKPKCFIVTPIGEEGTPERQAAELWRYLIVDPTMAHFDYHVKAANEISEPGLIPSQVINAILNADLIIANTAGHNPNVFYELALADMAQKPVIIMMFEGERLPFDVSAQRAIPYSLDQVAKIKLAKQQMANAINTIRSENFTVENPVTFAGFREKANPGEGKIESAISVMIKELIQMRDRINVLESRASVHPGAYPGGQQRSPFSTILTGSEYSPFSSLASPFSGGLLASSEQAARDPADKDGD